MTRDAARALLNLGAALQRLAYRHVCITPATHARVNARPGHEWATDLTGVFGWSRPFHAEILPPGIFELMQQAGITVPFQGGWRSSLRASTLNSQLYFHSAWSTDAPDSVFFGPDTYRYVAAISRHLSENPLSVPSHRGSEHPPHQAFRAVDLGCGAGPGAVELALRLPGAQILALDINDAALHLSRINAALAGALLQVRRSDLLTDVEGDFDLIAANPPYLPDPAARSYRHGGDPLGAEVSLNILHTALPRLRPGGTLLLYTGSAIVDGEDRLLAEAARLLQHRCTWSYQEIDPDVFGEELDLEPLAHADRIAAVLLCCQAPSRRPGG